MAYKLLCVTKNIHFVSARRRSCYYNNVSCDPHSNCHYCLHDFQAEENEENGSTLATDATTTTDAKWNK
jgi:hypothetical protein